MSKPVEIVSLRKSVTRIINPFIRLYIPHKLSPFYIVINNGGKLLCFALSHSFLPQRLTQLDDISRGRVRTN